MTILELREKRNKAWEAAKAFVETKRDKDGLLSAEDAATYAEMEQKVQNYSAESTYGRDGGYGSYGSYGSRA